MRLSKRHADRRRIVVQISQMTVRGHERLSTGGAGARRRAAREKHPRVVARRVAEEAAVVAMGESATIRRVLPSTLEISVQERRPMALAGSAPRCI